MTKIYDIEQRYFTKVADSLKQNSDITISEIKACFPHFNTYLSYVARSEWKFLDRVEQLNRLNVNLLIFEVVRLWAADNYLEFTDKYVDFDQLDMDNLTNQFQNLGETYDQFKVFNRHSIKLGGEFASAYIYLMVVLGLSNANNAVEQ